jgi:hypothetical protein
MPGLQEIVHIIPLGHEYDRAIAPFHKRHADRIHILSVDDPKKYPKKMIDRQKHFTDKVMEFFKDKEINVEFHEVNMFDLLEVMKHVSSVIVREKKAGNSVYVNMSACGRLTSVGATLAAMARGVIVYYVRAEDYSLDTVTFLDHGLSVCTSGESFMFENFHFDEPDEISKRILAELYRKEKGLKTREISKLLHQDGVPGFELDPDDIPKSLSYAKKRLEAAKQFMKMEKRYLEKLERSEYIHRVKSGRDNIITITESGKYIACISGMTDSSKGKYLDEDRSRNEKMVN